MITVKDLIKQLLDNSLTVNDKVKIDGSTLIDLDKIFDIKEDKGWTLFVYKKEK